LQFGKASDCDAITCGSAIGGRTATVPEKADPSRRLARPLKERKPVSWTDSP